MPIFEYQCQRCDQRFEILGARNDRAALSCPQCGATTVERLISTFSVGRSPSRGTSPGPCGTTDCACRQQ